MNGLYDQYYANTNHMRHSSQGEQDAYGRMLDEISVPPILEQEYMQRTNRLMRHMGRLKEQNQQLRELVERIWLIRHNDPASFEWVRVIEEAERLGITLEHQK